MHRDTPGRQFTQMSVGEQVRGGDEQQGEDQSSIQVTWAFGDRPILPSHQ